MKKKNHSRLTHLVPCEECDGNGTIRIANARELRRTREKKKISLRGLASRFKVSAPFLGDVERGRRPCPERILKAYEKL